MHKPILICLTLALMPIPAVLQAQESDLSRGVDLLNEGTRLLLRGLLEGMQPAAEGWSQLVEMVQDFNAYHLPVMLPNGDIIIRRIEPLKPDIGENGEVDL